MRDSTTAQTGGRSGQESNIPQGLCSIDRKQTLNLFTLRWVFVNYSYWVFVALHKYVSKKQKQKRERKVKIPTAWHSSRYPGTTVDFYSNYWEIDRLENTKATTTIRKLKAHFARFGIQTTLDSDSGTNCSADQFRKFTHYFLLCLKLNTLSAHHIMVSQMEKWRLP